MDRRHDPARRTCPGAEETPRDALVDALWLGGEAIVAPECRAAEDTRRSGDDPDPDWQVL